ncbi:hypothetical protein PAXRUDRAFT_766419 [Paxillus rubicundulus Ve08.2h10]|uniref:Uncharacterized protein n=1 Tax=Paxillus rubicundulus Ve08.2h10 TaxID=930991 RepID=A0A0D0CXG3_9AGAM|nr:hypothetical protein PAXRUDRAFT_766419 [Paxillus rubicundulus Ve08.2h10]
MRDFTAVFEALEHCQTTASQFLKTVLTHWQYDNQPIVQDLLLHSTEVLGTFLAHPIKAQDFMQHCAELILDLYLKEICHAASKDGGWHFGASTATTQQLEDFNLDDMAWDLKAHAPRLWTFVGLLMQCDEKQKGGSGKKDVDGDVVMDKQSMDMEQDYWNEVDEVDFEEFIEGLTAEGGPSIPMKDHKKWQVVIKTIKKIVIISIIMQSVNWKLNTLQTILGLFLQSAHTLQKVIDTLVQAGISISTDAINAAVCSLSIKSQTLL